MSSYIFIKVEDREKSNLKSISNYLSFTIVSALAKDHKFSPCINQRPFGLSSKIEHGKITDKNTIYLNMNGTFLGQKVK